MSEIKIVKGDITKMAADAIVNAANKSLLGGGGVDGAIHQAAGPSLLKECRTLHGCDTGQAKITKGYNLPAKYVIHTVGPIYRFHSPEEDARLLRACYQNSLSLAKSYHLKRIIFSAISTGVYGYPLKEAAKVAISAINDWLKENGDGLEVSLCAFDDEMYKIYLETIK